MEVGRMKETSYINIIHIVYMTDYYYVKGTSSKRVGQFALVLENNNNTVI